MGLLVHVIWGDAWRRPREGLGRVVERVQRASLATPKPAGPEDPSVDIYIYVSGGVWQHGREGFRLGTLTTRGRDWLRVMIYVPDELEEESAAVDYFRDTLNSVAAAVEKRLSARRPNWPVEELVTQVRSLRPERPAAA
jgi:hypothetical protein